jgi:hypothetical protein
MNAWDHLLGGETQYRAMLHVQILDRFGRARPEAGALEAKLSAMSTADLKTMERKTFGCCCVEQRMWASLLI